MSNTLKVVIAVGSALLVGVIVGYALGASGKGDLEDVAKQAAQKLKANETALADAKREAKQQVDSLEKGRGLLRCRVSLLRAMVELWSSNYGNASQQIGKARSQLERVSKLLSKKKQEEVKQLLTTMMQTQQLVMRLDPLSKKYLDNLLHDIRRIPGAR
ncbi:MAG: hypothetical protein KC503_00430 [Myxococcales bacterium]|nr:hypothetical protein [Myxococcales bacterium]